MSNLDKKWFTQVDDIIGGWCISTIDKPCSQWTQEDLEDGAFIGEFMRRETADHIVQLHNRYVDFMELKFNSTKEARKLERKIEALGKKIDQAVGEVINHNNYLLGKHGVEE